MVDLDQINITPDVWQAWQEKARQAVAELVSKGELVRPEEIPDEQARMEDDGSLTVFVVLPNNEEVSMRVPPDQWEWRFPKN
ncbi:MAG: hypothetical protein AAB451_02650 [Patescibacteria group bacterium]